MNTQQMKGVHIMTQNEINEVRERRINAAISMIKEAYQVDGYGVAALIGMSKNKWTRNEKAPWGKKTSSLYFGIAQLTGLSLSWLCAEDLDPVC